MKNTEIKVLVTDLVTLIQALPNSSTIEPLDLKARESEGVYETEYSRNSVDDKTTEYLDIFFKDHSSHISVIADSQRYTLEVNPVRALDYEGERLVTIPRAH